MRRHPHPSTLALYSTAILLVLSSICLTPPAQALSALLRAEQLVASTDPYIGQHNEKATLAWGASYHMLAYVVLFETNHKLYYLDRAVRLADSILKQRDDLRVVKDYRGKSTACWRNLHYQPQNQPYCYVVHSGIITYPIARVVELIRQNPTLAKQLAYDKQTYTQKANTYQKAVQATIDAHADQWRDKSTSQGYYIFRKDATFLSFAGKAMPLNQQNTLGRTIAVMARITRSTTHRTQLDKMCGYFKSFLQTSGKAYVWNYWPTAYKSPGEDISHAAINADFAVSCYKSSSTFNKTDLTRFAHTLFDNVYKSSNLWSNFVGSGTTDNKYADQLGRWLRLTEAWPVIYGPIRTYFERKYASNKTASSSVLLAHAYLAAYEPKLTHHGFYVADWNDLGSYQQATAHGANLIATPPDPKQPALIRLKYASTGDIAQQQWNGKVYTTILKLPSSGGKTVSEWFVFDPQLWFSYYRGNSLFQFKDATFVAGKGIKVWEQTPLTPPMITSQPDTKASTGQPYRYNPKGIPTATGSKPMRWRLTTAPADASVDENTGKLTWTPKQPGTSKFILALQNDVGSTSQSWQVDVQDNTTPEPTPEHTTEPISEHTPDSGLTENIQDSHTEPTPEPNPTEQMKDNSPEPLADSRLLDAGAESAPEQMKDTTPQERKTDRPAQHDATRQPPEQPLEHDMSKGTTGCACNTENSSPTPLWLLWGGLILLSGLSRTSRRF